MTELKQYQMFIDGQWVDSQDGKTFISINPATGKAWAEVPEASEADVNRAVEAAHRAFTEGPWSSMTATARGKLMRRLADALSEHSESLGRCETVDTGKLFKETRWQANYISDFFHYYAGLADKVCGETLPIDDDDPARAAGCRRCCRTLELATFSGRGQDRPSPGGWQHGRSQSIRTCLGPNARICPSFRRSWFSARGFQRRYRARRTLWPNAHQTPTS